MYHDKKYLSSIRRPTARLPLVFTNFYRTIENFYLKAFFPTSIAGGVAGPRGRVEDGEQQQQRRGQQPPSHSHSKMLNLIKTMSTVRNENICNSQNGGV